MGALSLDILGPAFVAGLLILATHVPLGQIVLARGIVFIGIALAQVAVLGLDFGTIMWGPSWGAQLGAFGAAVGCASLLAWTDRSFPAAQEAIIGVFYIVAAAAQIALLSFTPTAGEHLKELLVGQILWVSPTQLLVVGLVYAAVFAVWYFRDLAHERTVFYAVFAVVIAVSVQVVGLLLVFASLIIPALATLRASARWRLAIAFNIGAIGYLGGLVVSSILNIPGGPAIVCTLAFVALVVGRLAARGPKSAEELDRSRVEALQDEIHSRLTKARVA